MHNISGHYLLAQYGNIYFVLSHFMLSGIYLNTRCTTTEKCIGDTQLSMQLTEAVLLEGIFMHYNCINGFLVNIFCSHWNEECLLELVSIFVELTVWNDNCKSSKKLHAVMQCLYNGPKEIDKHYFTIFS